MARAFSAAACICFVPSSTELQAVSEQDVTTLFTEALVNPKVAETLAADLGITTAVLDPVESQSDPGADYRDAMDANLAALRLALGCS